MELGTAPVLEVFASYQGEGLFVGQPQTFLRLAGCPLRCTYCDTPHSWARPSATTGDFVTPFEALVRVMRAEYDTERPISVTGGEPLIWPDFLMGLRHVAGARALHLETAGHDLGLLRRVAPSFDHLSLDLKLSADLAPPAAHDFPEAELPESAADFDHLRTGQLALLAERARAGKQDCVKLVVQSNTDPNAFVSLLEDVKRLAPQLSLFIAPASLRRDQAFGDLSTLDQVVSMALELDLEPRVLPQMHRALGVR